MEGNFPLGLREFCYLLHNAIKSCNKYYLTKFNLQRAKKTQNEILIKLTD